MPTPNKLSGTLFLTLSCCLSWASILNADEHLPTFSSMTIFGDSSEDTGNWNSKANVIAPSFVNPDPPYMDGRFSNGLTWTDNLAGFLGVPMPTASELEGENNTNYAWGGATTGAVRRIDAVDDIDEQLPKYLRDHTPAEDELFVVSAGPNDITASPSIDPEKPVAAIVKHIEALVDAGAMNFLVNTLEVFPGEQNQEQQRHLNGLLREKIPPLRDEHNVALYFFDAEKAVDKIVESPDDYGLVNVDDYACDCLNSDQSRKSSPVVVENPNEYLQWDGHATARGAEILSQFALEAFTVVGDFDRNGGLGGNDIDLLAEAIRSASDDIDFDLNGDGVVDSTDHSFFVTSLASTYAGDANLDGEVGFDDFLGLAANFGMEGGWNAGNFNLDIEIGFDDFLILAENFGRPSSGEVRSVPEPNSLWMLGLACFCLMRSRIRCIAKSVEPC